MTEAVAAVPDPRNARGKRHSWTLLLTLLAAALVCGQRPGRAIGHWVEAPAEEIRAHLALPDRPLPSTSTLRRALHALDVTALVGAEDRALGGIGRMEPDRGIVRRIAWLGHRHGFDRGRDLPLAGLPRQPQPAAEAQDG